MVEEERVREREEGRDLGGGEMRGKERGRSGEEMGGKEKRVE